MIESWGLGIEKMRQACRSRGLPDPTLRVEAQGLWVELRFAPVKTPVKTPDLILLALTGQPAMSLSEVATHIDKSVSAVERAVARLVKQNRLRHVGPAKGGHWEVVR